MTRHWGYNAASLAFLTFYFEIQKAPEKPVVHILINPQKTGVATHIHLFGLEWYVYTPSKLIIWVISQNLGAKSRKQDTVPTQS